MSAPEHLTADEIATLRSVAAALIPGSQDSPAAATLTNFDELLDLAAGALGADRELLRDSVRLLPPAVGWEQLADFAAGQPAAFEVISTTVSGAYFMSPAVLQSIGYFTGTRRPAPYDLVANELESGILEPMTAWKHREWPPAAENPAGPRNSG
jgi:hypothetical protein